MGAALALALAASVSHAAKRKEVAVHPKHKPVALLVILDISGSMTVGKETSKYELANAAVVVAMEMLGPKDLFGLLAIDTKAYLVVPFQPPHPLLARHISKISAAGRGPHVYNALARAEKLFESVESSLRRHIVFLTDGGITYICRDGESDDMGLAPGCPSMETAYEITWRMKEREITLSVITSVDPRSEAARALGWLSTHYGGGSFHIIRPAGWAGAMQGELVAISATARK